MKVREAIGDEPIEVSAQELLIEAREDIRKSRNVNAMLDLAQWVFSLLLAGVLARRSGWTLIVEIIALSFLFRISLAASGAQAMQALRRERMEEIADDLSEEIRNGST